MSAARADRLYQRYVAWLGRGALMVVAGVMVFFAATLLVPGLSWVALTGAGILIAAGCLCMLTGFVNLARWILARRLFYRALPEAKRREVYRNELRNRGAPNWYVQGGRRLRVAYVLSVIMLAFVAVPLLLYSIGAPLVALGLAPLSVLLLLGLLHRLLNRSAVRDRRFDPRLQVAAGETPIGGADHRQQPDDDPAEVRKR